MPSIILLEPAECAYLKMVFGNYDHTTHASAFAGIYTLPVITPIDWVIPSTNTVPVGKVKHDAR